MRAAWPRVGCKPGAGKGSFCRHTIFRNKGETGPFSAPMVLVGNLPLWGSKESAAQQGLMNQENCALAGDKSDNRKTGQFNHLQEDDNPGIVALHMAASPKEDNTVRTRTATPDWWS